MPKDQSKKMEQFETGPTANTFESKIETFPLEIRQNLSEESKESEIRTTHHSDELIMDVGNTTIQLSKENGTQNEGFLIELTVRQINDIDRQQLEEVYRATERTLKNNFDILNTVWDE